MQIAKWVIKFIVAAVLVVMFGQWQYDNGSKDCSAKYSDVSTLSDLLNKKGFAVIPKEQLKGIEDAMGFAGKTLREATAQLEEDGKTIDKLLRVIESLK